MMFAAAREKKAEPKPAFPAISITRSNELVSLPQGYPSSSLESAGGAGELTLTILTILREG
jgi:hypothetical protein